MYMMRVLALLAILIPCILCIQTEDNRHHIEELQSIDDLVAYLMNPHSEYDGDESEFDSVGHNEKETSNESENLVNEESPGVLDGGKEKEKEEKKSKIESVDEDDDLFTGNGGFWNIEI